MNVNAVGLSVSSYLRIYMNSRQTVIFAMFSTGSSSDDSLAASLMLALLTMLSADSIAEDRLDASLMLALLTMLSADAFAVDRLVASLMLALLTMLSADSIAVDRLAASLTMLAHHTIRLATSGMVQAWVGHFVTSITLP